MIKRKSYGIRGLGFRPVFKFPRCVTQFCEVPRGEVLCFVWNFQG